MANEVRLIDANALDEQLYEAMKKYDAYDNCQAKIVGGIMEAQDILNDAPTVDAVPVVHGRWKYYHKQNIAVCTNCSFERNLDANFGKAVSCPNCGADMRNNKDG